jgi:CHAT domain-containing protein
MQAARTLETRRNSSTLTDDARIAAVAGRKDRAIVELSEAVAHDPGNAVAWSDLASVHLQGRPAESDPYEIVLALAAADHALQLDPHLLAARFNRGLALTHLSLKQAAAADWRFLLAHEHDRGWLREAQWRAAQGARASEQDWNAELTTLRQSIQRSDKGKVYATVNSSAQRFREFAEEDLLPSWGKRGSPESLESRSEARAIGDALSNRGEWMVADTVAQVDHLESARRLKLAGGLAQYGEGISLIRRGDFSLALLPFRRARLSLQQLRSPFAGWATCQIAYCLYQNFDYRAARTELVSLLRSPNQGRYKALRGRALWLLGDIEGLEGSPSAAVTSFESSLVEFQRLEEKANVASLRALLAYHLYILGQRTEAWKCLYPVWVEPNGLDKPQARSLVYEVASAMAREHGDAEAALWFHDELLRAAQDRGVAYAIAEALRGRASLLTSLGRKEPATADLARARSYLARVSGPLLRKSLEGNIWLVESELASVTSPGDVIAALDPAVQIFRDTSYHFQLWQALARRGLAEISLHRNADAERDLSEAIAESEQQRERVTSPEDRISYFDRTRELLDTMISFQLDRRHQAVAALHFSEQAKARVLWDWILTQPTGGLEPQNLNRTLLTSSDTKPLQQDLPAGIAVIEYAVLPQSTAIWVLRRGAEPKVVTIKDGAKAIGDLVQRLHRAVLAVAVQTTSEALYDSLIAPIAQNLVPGERLVFVPDGALHALPFTLLRDPKTRRYLIQDHVCSVAPSIRVLKASLHRAEALARDRPQRALMIASPDPDRGLYPALAQLDSAETAAAVAQIFPGSVVLRAQNATRNAFVQSAGDFEIVHFGGHSVVNTEFPLLSQMVLAPAPGDPNRGVLYSGDILHQRFPRTRLVVLASCATAAGKISRTEGVENLARPFLAAGVPVVVASLWDVNDKPTGDFFSRFYANLRKGWDVAGSLQATQADFIEHGAGADASPRTWAAFEVIGGSVPQGTR